MTVGTLHRWTLSVAAVLVAAFVVLNTYGALTKGELWLFQAWAYTPTWYLILWVAVTAGFCLCIWKYHSAIASACESKLMRLAFLATLILMIVGFHYDSFVFGSGNLRIAQMAQVDTIQLRPNEFGAQAIVSSIFRLLKASGLAANTAGFWGWQMYSFLSSALAIWGIIRLAGAVAIRQEARVVFTAICIFAGPFLMFCGYIGVEPIVVPTTVWFALAAYRLSQEFTLGRLVALWGLVAIAAVGAILNLFLVPAAVCVTVASLWRRSWTWLIAGVVGLLAMGAMISLLYFAAARSMAVSQQLVMPDGKLPLVQYSLTSLQNLWDKASVVLVAAPLAPLLLVLIWRRPESEADKIFAATILVAVIAGRSVQVALDPTAGIVLDFPRLTAFLAPLSIALAFFLDRRSRDRIVTNRFKMTIAGLCVLLPLSVSPVFTKISLVDPLAKAMAERHNDYYRTTGLAFRDAWFYNRQLDAANAWEWSLPVNSPDFLNLRGCYDLVQGNQTGDAIVSLYRLTARQPYWAEPRSLLAAIQLKVGRPLMAKPHIDTCLQLDPCEKSHHVNLYRYYQAVGRYDSAMTAAERSCALFPKDLDIRSDLMIFVMKSGLIDSANSLANSILNSDTTVAYPHLIKGRIAEQSQLIDSALVEFRRFLRYAPPGNPDVEAVGKHVAELIKLKNQN